MDGEQTVRRARIVSALGRNSVLPAILAPMYRVSGPELVLAGRRAGMVSALPTQTPATIDELAGWLTAVSRGLVDDTDPAAAWGVSMVAHSTYRRFEAELELVADARPDFVVTALGSPRRALDAVHAYGGFVFADVNSVRLARKAADAGADGLILVCGGAGGQTGSANPFGFVEEVRRFFDGVIVLAGAISTGRGVRAAEVMGADFAYVGTHFIPARESLADPAHKAAVLEAGLDDIVTTPIVTGVAGTFTRQSLIAAGFDPDSHQDRKVDFAQTFDGAPRARAYAAGHGAAMSEQATDVARLVASLSEEYAAACALSSRRDGIR